MGLAWWRGCHAGRLVTWLYVSCGRCGCVTYILQQSEVFDNTYLCSACVADMRVCKRSRCQEGRLHGVRCLACYACRRPSSAWACNFNCCFSLPAAWQPKAPERLSRTCLLLPYRRSFSLGLAPSIHPSIPRSSSLDPARFLVA